MNWTRLRLTAPVNDAEVCAQLLLEAGCAGVEIVDSAVLLDESEDATVIRTAQASATGYIQAHNQVAGAQAFLTSVLEQGRITARLEVQAIADEDWATSWRENFPPLRVGPFLIVPPWEVLPEAAHANVLRIDPGLAFGTGQHPTTRMCLELLSERLELRRQIKRAPSLLDVGCGSGILSIAAALLGARVTASDLDGFCIQATRANAAANDVTFNVVQAVGLDWVATRFDFVVANLMSALLIGLAPGLAQATSSGGTLVASGISAPRAAEVEAALHQAGFVTVERRDQDGEQRGDFTERWTAFVMQN